MGIEGPLYVNWSSFLVSAGNDCLRPITEHWASKFQHHSEQQGHGRKLDIITDQLPLHNPKKVLRESGLYSRHFLQTKATRIYLIYKNYIKLDRDESSFISEIIKLDAIVIKISWGRRTENIFPPNVNHNLEF